MIEYDTNGNKKCSKCGLFKPLDLFGNVHTTFDKKRSQCKACINLYKNTDVWKAAQKRYAAGPAGKAKKRRHKERYPEKEIARKQRYYRKRKGVVRSSHPSIKPYIPAWLTKEQLEQINDFYVRCPIGYDVDHIHPRVGKNDKGEHISCGLHVPWNLQYLPRLENQKKGSKLK